MATREDKTDELRDLYRDLTGEEVVTEEQNEGPSHDPIGEEEIALEEEVSELTRETGLEDAMDEPDQ